MGTFRLKKFAMDMDGEIANLGSLALGGMASLPVGTPATAPQPQDMQSYWMQGMLDRGIDPVFAQGMMPNIGDESGWQIDIQEKAPLAGRGGRGAYQLTGDRRDEFERRYGTNYSADNQLDFLAWEVLEGPERGNYQRIIAEAGGDPRKAAAGVVNYFLRPAEEHRQARANKYLGGSGVTMSAQNQPGFFPNGGERLPIDTAELERLAESMDPETVKRRHQGAMLMAIGQGLGQMSRGNPIDLSGVMNAYAERQAEARQRLMEIAMERRRQQEYNTGWDRQVSMQQMEEQAAQEAAIQGREWSVADREDAQRHDVDMTARSEKFQLGNAALQRGWQLEDLATGRQHDIQLLTIKEILDQQAADPSEAEAQIARLMETGLTRDEAISLRDGRTDIAQNPVTGITQLIDKSNGDVIRVIDPGTDYGAATVPTPEGLDENIDLSASFGVGAAAATPLNAMSDFFGVTNGLPFEQVKQAQTFWNNLSKDTLFTLSAGIGERPAVWTQQKIEELLPTKASGPLGALDSAKALRDTISGEIERIQKLYIDAPNNWDQATMQDATARKNELETLLGKYNFAVDNLTQRTKGERPPLDSFRR